MKAEEKVPVPVLVPFQSKPFFEQYETFDIRAVFYRLRQESFLQKGLRKLGWRDAAQTLAAKFEIVQDEELLGEVFALWLSPAIRLSASQMGYLLDLSRLLKWFSYRVIGPYPLNL